MPLPSGHLEQVSQDGDDWPADQEIQSERGRKDRGRRTDQPREQAKATRLDQPERIVGGQRQKESAQCPGQQK